MDTCLHVSLPFTVTHLLLNSSFGLNSLVTYVHTVCIYTYVHMHTTMYVKVVALLRAGKK